MKHFFLLISITIGLLTPIAAEAFWGLTEREQELCRDRASQEKNEFSAKQTYEYCKKNIRKELIENSKAQKEASESREKKDKEWSLKCKELERQHRETDYSQYDELVRGLARSLGRDKIENCWDTYNYP